MALRDTANKPNPAARYQSLSPSKENLNRPQKHGRKGNGWLRTWTPEILSASLSVALFASTIAILQAYRDKPQPEFALSLSLNGLLQILITFNQFSFSYPLARGLAQLKWLWFLPRHSRDTSSRPLHKFEVYDEACRSNLLGSLKLIFRLGWGGRNG